MATSNRGRGRGRQQASEMDKQVSLLQKRGKIARNVFTQMEGCCYGPLSILYKSMTERLQVKVWIRSYRHVRGICTGYIVAFDQHQNLAMCDVDEVYKLPNELNIRKRPRKRGGKNLRRHKQSAKQEEQCSILPENQEVAASILFSTSETINSTGDSSVNPISSHTVKSSDVSQDVGTTELNINLVTADLTEENIIEKPIEMEATSTIPSIHGCETHKTTTNDDFSSEKDETSESQIEHSKHDESHYDVEVEDIDISSQSSTDMSFQMDDMMVLDEFYETDSSDVLNISDDDEELKLLEEKLAELTALLEKLSDESSDTGSELEKTLTENLLEENLVDDNVSDSDISDHHDQSVSETHSDPISETHSETDNLAFIEPTNVPTEERLPSHSGLEEGEVDSDEKLDYASDVRLGSEIWGQSLSTSPRLVVKLKPIEDDITSNASKKGGETSCLLMEKAKKGSVESKSSNQKGIKSSSSRHDQRKIDSNKQLLEKRCFSKRDTRHTSRRSEKELSCDKDRRSGGKLPSGSLDQDNRTPNEEWNSKERASERHREETRSHYSDRSFREKDSKSDYSDRTQHRPIRDLRELLLKKEPSKHDLRSRRSTELDRSREEKQRHEEKDSSSRDRADKDYCHRERKTDRLKVEVRRDRDEGSRDVHRRDRHRDLERRKYEDSHRSRDAEREQRGKDSNRENRDRDNTRKTSTRHQRTEPGRTRTRYTEREDRREYDRHTRRGARRSRERSGSPRVRSKDEKSDKEFYKHRETDKSERSEKEKLISKSIKYNLSMIKAESSRRNKKELNEDKDEPPPVLTRVITESFEKFSLKGSGIPPGYAKRHVNQLFIRGDNVVMVAIVDHSY